MNPKDLIPTPCHEDWNAMNGDQQRKFCNKCSTHVHDLTDYSEDEILALKVQNGGKLCGSFRLAKPLSIGVGIASLALAACQPEPEHTVGIICPTAQNSAAEKTKPIETVRGQVQSPNKNINKPTSKNPLQVDPPSIDKHAPPHEGMILGIIAPPNPHTPSPVFIRKGEVIKKTS